MKALLLYTLLGVLVAGLFVVAWLRLDATAQEGGGTVEVDIRQLDLDDGQLSLDARANVSLPQTVATGLDNGVPLTFVLELQIIEPNSFWRNTTLFSLERHFRLTYYELTRHYRVEIEETEVSRNFRSLSSALDGLGELVALEVPLDETQADELEHAGLVASLRLSLSRTALPLPLQPVIRSSWTLASEEYRWPVI